MNQETSDIRNQESCIRQHPESRNYPVFMKILVAQLGARMHYAVPEIFYRAGMLEKLYTDVYVGDKVLMEKILKPFSGKFPGIARLLSRKSDVIPLDKVVSFDLLGLWYCWKQQRAKDVYELSEVFAKGGKAFNLEILKNGFKRVDAIYGFQSASLELFRYAKTQGVKCILEQTIAPRKIQHKLLIEEIERWNGWQPGLKIESDKDPLAEREEAEWRVADLILGGSQFVVDSLQSLGVQFEKCKVVPYGVSLEKFQVIKKEPLNGRPLRLLFIGEVGLRKGVPYLLEALRMLKSKYIQAKLLGKNALSKEIVNKYATYADFVGTVPRSEIKSYYDWADVFVLPSICEGSATVTYEALASGIPVIATPNTGSVVRNGVDGHIVPIRSSDAIVAILEGYLKTPGLLQAEQNEAITGRERLGIEAYGERLIKAIDSCVSQYL